MKTKRKLLNHFLAALAYRTQKALRDAPENFGSFRATNGVRTPAELVRHMTSVLGYARTHFIVAEIEPDRLGPDQAEPVSPDKVWPEAPPGWKSLSRHKNHKGHKTNQKMTRKILILIALIISPALFFNEAIAQEEFKPTTVFLIRHAEREDEPKQDPPLRKEGIARSQELARLLSTAGIKAIVTSQFARTKQTAEPLATKLGLTVTSISLKSNPTNPRLIAEESTAEVVNKILERAGESVLVVGHSNSIPDVIKMLGGDIVPTIDERKFDNLFIVTVYAKGKAKVVHLKYGPE